MRKATRDKWEAFVPATNCLWMHYLADICLAQVRRHPLNSPA